MKYSSLSMAAAFGNVMASASSPHSGGSISIHLLRWQGGSAMVDVAVEGGGISGDANSGEGRWGDVLEVANDVGSGVIAKPNTLEVGLVGGNVGWEGDSSGSGVEDVSSLAGRREDVVDIHESSGENSGVFAVVSWQDSVQGLAVSRRDGVESSEKNSEAVEDDIVDGGEEENDGLKRPESPKMSRIQKILDSARMGGISGPLLIQPSIFFNNDDLATSTNKGDLVDDGAESQVSNSSLASPSSRAVIVQDEDPGVSIHSMADEDESANVSKPEVNMDVLPESKNLSLKLKANDDGQVDSSVHDTIVDVSSDTSTNTLEETKGKSNSNRPNFLVAFVVLIFVMITATSSFFLCSRLRSMIDLPLSSVYARALYDRVCKTLRIVLFKSSLLYPKSNHSGGKKSRRKGRGKGRGRNRNKAKQKAVPPQLTGYLSLVLMVMTGVLCILGSGEAVWFSHNNDSKVVEGVNEVLDDGVVEGISIETDSVGVNSSGDDDDVQQDQAVFDQSISSVGLDGIALQDYGFGSELQPHHSELVSLQNELSDVHSELAQIVSDDASSKQEVMKATSKTMSLVKDRMVDLELSKSLPSHLQPLVKNALTQITKAEKHMKEVEDLVSQYDGLDGFAETNLEKASKVPSHHRKLLSRNQGSNDKESSSKYSFKRGITKADHHYRAKSRHIGQGFPIHGLLGDHLGHGHQQGHHGARVSRQEGKMQRRLMETEDDESLCIELPSVEQKKEQCYRLAECAKNYGLYDTFAFFFADDIDFGTGKVDDNVVAFDEVELRAKRDEIQRLSIDILDQYNDTDKENIQFDGDNSTLEKVQFDQQLNERTCPTSTLNQEGRDIGCACDNLLRQFHRYDEDLSVEGKWGGGSVTGVCRGWGTNKSIFQIGLTALIDDPVEECLEDEVLATFNQDVAEDTLLITSPNQCIGGTKSSDEALCCPSTCTSAQCGGTGNKFTGGQCRGASNTVVKKLVDIPDIPLGIFGTISCSDCDDEITGICSGLLDAQFPNRVGCKIPVDVTDETECCGSDGSGCCKDDCCQRDLTDMCKKVNDVGCTIDDSLVTFNVPENPCQANVSSIEFQGLLKDGATQASFRSEVETKVDKAVKCLYYSYFITQIAPGKSLTCDSLTGTRDKDEIKMECELSCAGLLDPVFTLTSNRPTSNAFSETPCTEAPVDPTAKCYWDYRFSPASLLISDRKTFLQTELINGKLPQSALSAGTAANFTIDVFDEFMGCSNDIVESLNAQIFSDNVGTNAYAPDNSNQFQLPLRLNGNALDEHGQIKSDSAFLDKAFFYQPVGKSNGIDDSGATPMFSTNLDTLLVESYAKGVDLVLEIEKEEELLEKEKEKNPCDGACKAEIDRLKVLIKDYEEQLETLTNQGLVRSQLDDSIALLYGNKTTIGQVCSYAKGLEVDSAGESIVDGTPGFCCLDAPYESNAWGETYSCQKYVLDGSGQDVAVQKNDTDCNRLGPVTAGFNQAACDIFQGQWCPNPRDCFTLNKCIKDEIKEVAESGSRPVFLQYLEDSPVLEDTETDDITKCGELREYFEYDKNYPDDDRICNEVRELQCLTDFSNLDGLVTGTAGAGSALEELAVSEVLVLNTVENPCDEAASLEWRSRNFILKKVGEGIKNFINKQLTSALEFCDLIPIIGGTDVARAVCKAPITTAITISDVVLFAAETLSDVSDRAYSEVCTPSPSQVESDEMKGRQYSIYKNVITNHGNIITTFQATQQLKIMLGEVSDGVKEANEALLEDKNRRLQLEDCVNTTSADGFKRGCNQTSCEDITKLCDGSPNYPYIATLRQAGCDDLDSDGSGKVDDCEDRKEPEILVRDAKIFRCDRDDTSKLCYTDKWFKNATDAENFLEYEFAVSDDCAPSNKLFVDIMKTSGECQNTEYTITPSQNYSECVGYDYGSRSPLKDVPFVNPLSGTPKVVTMQLDEVAPVVECGFLVPNAYSANMVDGKTLYHYMLKTEGSGRRLNDARLKDAGFFYTVAENCDADVHVDVVVKSNELQQNTVAQLFKRERIGFVDQAEFLYAPTHCDCEKKVDGLCKTDASMGDLKTRYYDITVTATDYAGNVGSDACRVVIVPNCNPETDSDCEEYDRPELPNVEDFYYARSAVYDSVVESQVLNQVAQQKLKWEDGLAPLNPDVLIEEAVDIDDGPPNVTCGFFPDTNSINVLDEKTLYHYMLKKDGDNAQKQDARFFYTVTENCDADVQVDVVVESNEVQQNTVAQLFKRKRTDFQQQVKFFYNPASCESKDVDGLCEVDLSMGYLKTRYYNITVTATDAAGNIGSDTCRVVIVPSCKSQDPGCEKYYKRVPYEKDAESYYYRISAVDKSVDESEVLYEAAQQKLVWKSGLKTPQAPPNVPRSSSKSAKESYYYTAAGGEETKPWESDPTTSPTKSSQPSMTTLPSSQPSSSSRPTVKEITSPPSTSPTSAPTKPINCKKPEAKLDTKGNCKECCSGKCNRKKTKCQKVPIG